MKTNVVLALDNRRGGKSDGTRSILLRIVHHRKSTQIHTGISIPAKDWDSKRRIVKPSYRGTETVARLNNLLHKKRTEAMDIILKLHENNRLEAYTLQQLKELIENNSSSASLLSFGQTMVDQLKDANRIGSARAYACALQALKTFNKGKDVSFQELNFTFLTNFEIDHLKRGNSPNGLAAYLRSIRAIFNTAIKKGLVDREIYPFSVYQIKTVKTRKRAISFEAIQSIEKCVFHSKHKLFHARNYFLLSFYLRGISFTDLAHLKVKNIIENHIHYQRQKTDKPYTIKITDGARQILELYKVNKGKDDYILPIIKHEVFAKQYKEIEGARKRFNKKLKLLALKCNIGDDLTSYVSRHSFATRAKNLGIPIANISDMLGHEDIKTTQVYLDSLPSDELDKFHEMVIK